MAFKLFLAAACLTAVFASDAYRPKGYGGYQETYPDTKPYYNYAYTVKDDYSGNYYGQEEHRDGYETQGAYRVLLPDGRTQTVSYTANEYGYNADVQYDGYPSYDYKPAASYKPAPKYAPAPYKAAPAYKPAPKYAPAPYKAAPVYKAAPSYKPAYQPAYKPVYQAAASYHPEPAYAPAPYKPAYKPVYGKY